jgi:hypothetical protein
MQTELEKWCEVNRHIAASNDWDETLIRASDVMALLARCTLCEKVPVGYVQPCVLLHLGKWTHTPIESSICPQVFGVYDQPLYAPADIGKEG